MTAACAVVVVLVATLLITGLTPDAGSTASAQTTSSPAWRAPLPRGACHRAVLSRRPAWSASAAFTDGDELLVIDQMYNKVLRYSAAGESLGTLPGAVEASVEDFFPITVKTSGSQVMFELAGERISTLDAHYAPVSQAKLSQDVPSSTTGRSAASLLGSFQWQPLGNDVVSFSTLRTADADGKLEETCGFVRFPIANPSAFTVLAEFPESSPLRLFNRLGLQYLATLEGEGTAYTLRMDDLHIYRLGGATLEPLPIELPAVSRPPSLPPFKTKDDFATVMAAVETSTMPIGLYAWKDALFVVTRNYNHDATTTWTITKADPASGRILGTATIPTVASHLTIAPGPEHWAFIEKGPVNAWNEQQSIPSILFVAAGRFDGDLHGDLCDGGFTAPE